MSADPFEIDFSDHEKKQRFMARVGRLVGRWRMTFEVAGRRRSLKANARYWVSVVPAMQAFMREHGHYFNKDEVHEFFLQQIVGREVVDPMTGKILTVIGRRSSKMTTEQFADFTAHCEGLMVDRWGVIVPEYTPATTSKGAVAA